MYRIALQLTTATPNRASTFQYIQDKNTVFETENKQEALDRYEKELDNYKKSDLKLIKIIEIVMQLDGIDICSECGADCGCNGGGSTIDPDVPIEGAYSYNSLSDKPKINSVPLKNNKTAKDLHLQEEMEEYTNEEIDKLLSLQG